MLQKKPLKRILDICISLPAVVLLLLVVVLTVFGAF